MRERRSIIEESHSAAVRLAHSILIEAARLMSKEDVVPKRGRWLGADELMKVISRYHTLICTANAIRVTTAEEYIERHRCQTLAIAYLDAGVVKLNEIQIIFSIEPHKFNNILRYIDEAVRVNNGWMKSDEQRYNSQFGLSIDSSRLRGASESPNPSNSNNVRNVNPDGSLNNNNANNTNGAVPGLTITTREFE